MATSRRKSLPHRLEKKLNPRVVSRYALYCGTGAGVASNAALVLAARAEGRSAWRPLNATSHWFWGQKAGSRAVPDLAHSLTGAATNQAASMFWGAIFGSWLASRPPRTTGQMFRDAAVMAAIASAIDFGMMPKRLTPGWELALPKRSVAAVMGALAASLALGGFAAQSGRH